MIAELVEANARLVERVTALERAAGRNSGNSGMPPSTDDLPGRRKPVPPRRAKGSGRRRGKQDGAPGTSLPWAALPDEYVAHRPDGGCACGADLADAAQVGIARSHQVHDLPEVKIVVRQHDIYRVRCGCGREHVATLPPDVSSAPCSYGLNLRSLVVYLLVYQHVPVARCVELIADLTGGSGPSTGFVHGMLDRAAATLHEVLDLIKTLITLSHVVGFDETTLKAGPAGTKRYVLSAVTEFYSLFGLGGRDLDSFRDFDILPDFAGIAVHDRYQNYYNQRWEHLAAHQACTAHLLRDFTDAAEAHPDAVWPEQAQRALRGLVHAFNTARDTGQAEIPALVRDPLINTFRHAVRVGLVEVPANPGPRSRTKQPPGGFCWSSAATARTTSCASPATPGSGRPTTSANAPCARRRLSRTSPGGSPARSSPRTASTSAATSTPSANTATTSSPASATPSPATPGDHRASHRPDLPPQLSNPPTSPNPRRLRTPPDPGPERLRHHLPTL